MVIGDWLMHDILTNNSTNQIIDDNAIIIKNEFQFLEKIGYKMYFYYIPFGSKIGKSKNKCIALNCPAFSDDFLIFFGVFYFFCFWGLVSGCQVVEKACVCRGVHSRVAV